MSVSHLGRCFRQETGLTPMAYLNRYRVNRAKELLATGHKSIAEVAPKVGFSSVSHFSHVFRKESGVSPSVYQRGRRKPK